ncbi:MAG TPA: DUF4920 domain-containing protein, partial [Flavobacteriales bacterium]|nr:DUF4920 domain-containing protein [Flavobacteriales bacterium]
MKTLFSLLALALAVTLHAQEPVQTDRDPGSYISYGDAITPDGAIGMAEFEAAAARKDSLEAKVEGEIIESCTKKGCWMTV